MHCKGFCCNFSIRIAYKWHHSHLSLCISQTGTTQTTDARDKGGNFIGQLCISVAVPQISSVSAYITQFKMPNMHRISFPGVSDTHVKLYANILYYAGNYFSERNETQLIFTSTFRLCRVSLFFSVVHCAT